MREHDEAVRKFDSQRTATVPSAPTSIIPTTPAPVKHSSAWGEAVHVGSLRDGRVAQGRDSSVRAIARAAGCSSGRAGELLKIRDAFPDSLVLQIGIRTDAGDDDPLQPLPDRGTAQLSLLSYRALRAASRIPSVLARVAEVRRLAQAARDRESHRAGTTFSHAAMPAESEDL